MNKLSRRLVAWLSPVLWLLPSHASAQKQATARGPAPATARGGVEGDVYLMMKSGDTKRGAGRAISLLRDTPHLRSALDSTCFTYRTIWKAVRDSLDAVHKAIGAAADGALKEMSKNAGDRAAFERWNALSGHNIAYFDTLAQHQRVIEAVTMVQVRQALVSATVDTVSAGMNAHFMFARVPAGTYILFGEWKIGDNDYQWWAPVSVVASKTLRRDLDNSVEADNRVFCGIR